MSKTTPTDELENQELIDFANNQVTITRTRGSSRFDTVVPLNGNWKRFGACANIGNHIFYPSTGDTRTAAEAKAICRECKVRRLCLMDALIADTRGYEGGIRAGITASERRAMIRQNPGLLDLIIPEYIETTRTFSSY